MAHMENPAGQGGASGSKSVAKQNGTEVKSAPHANQATRSHHVAPDYAQPARSVYDGRDRIGSYRLACGRWIAVDRLNRAIGQYSTEREAANAIMAGGQP